MLNINARSLASRSLPIAAGFAFGPTPACHASAAPKMLAEKGPESEASPPPGRPIVNSGVGHHNRRRAHSVEAFDWAKITEFAKCHLMGEGRPQPGGRPRAQGWGFQALFQST